MPPRYRLYEPWSTGIALPNYRQRDDCSCGFVAALTVAEYLAGITPDQVLAATGPLDDGIDGESLATTLRALGLVVKYRDDLTLRSLQRYVDNNVPVMLTVYPKGWGCDHWTVVRALDHQVHLTNYRSVSLDRFEAEWFSCGEGLVVKRRTNNGSQ